MRDIKAKLKEQISTNLGSGLQATKQVIDPKSTAYNEILIFLQRYNDAERKHQRTGTISYEDYRLEINRITEGALQLIGSMNVEAINHTILVQEKIQQLRISHDRMGPLYLVNCDRDDLSESHWDYYYEEFNASKAQFYFLPACPLQKPPSFAERMVWELLMDELEDELEGLHYETKADSLRIKRADFEISKNQRLTQKALRKYFCKRFKIKDFDQWLKNDLTKSNYEYIATLFTIEINEWKRFLPDFLNWMIQTFQEQVSKESPTFIFYVVLYMDKFVRKPLNDRQEKIKEEVKGIIEQNKSCCTVLEGFEPVYINDIKRWFRKIGEDRPILIEEVVEAMTKSLRKDERERYLAGKGIDMARMERLQQMVYENNG